MNYGFSGLNDWYFDDDLVLKRYRKKLAARAVPVGRVEIDEADFDRTISVTDDGRVFYLDHVLIGVFSGGRFVGNRWAYKVVSMAGVRKVRRYLEGV